MKKERNIVMLPTEKASILSKAYLANPMHLRYLSTGFKDDAFKSNDNQHIYITSDEEIKEGDWYLYKRSFLDGTVKTQEQYDNADWLLKKCDNKEETSYTKRAQFGKNSENSIAGCYKIIATTDESLTIGEEDSWKNRKDILYPNKLPQIPTDFIKLYVEEYNKGNVIDKVLVEYQKYFKPGEVIYELKLNSDNTINISLPEETILDELRKNDDVKHYLREQCELANGKMYSREEVVEILHTYQEEHATNSQPVNKLLHNRVEEWIKENLK